MTFNDGEPDSVCRYCREEIVWHEGNGGQWLGAHPPRDWATCGGGTGPRSISHVADTPSELTRPALEAWLQA